MKTDKEGEGEAKVYLSQNRKSTMGRNQLSYQKYMDKMNQSLNQCITDNIDPYWRDHQSLKGKYTHSITDNSSRLVFNELPQSLVESITQKKRDTKRAQRD